jgi:hypothetical protein
MTINVARLADSQGNVTEAISLYESLIVEGSAEFIDYVNLICIYFNCLDLGYASARKVGAEIEKNCSTRAFELIDEAEEKFGKNDELTFWRSYIPYLGWGDEIGEWDLQGNSLVPYVYLALEFPTDENIQKARQLYSELEKIEDSERKNLFMGRLEDLVG